MKRLWYLALSTLMGTVISGMGCGSSSSESPATGGTIAQTGGVVASTGGVASGGSTPTGGTTTATGGTTAATIESLVPTDNDIAGWVVDTKVSKSDGKVAAIGKTAPQSEALIDGSASAFYKAPYSAVLAWQNYKNASNGYSLDLHIWELQSAALAKGIYTDLLANESLYSVNVWVTVAGMGDVARITNTGTTWWVNIQKSQYMIEFIVDKPPLGSEETDTTGRDVAKAYATELLKRFP